MYIINNQEDCNKTQYQHNPLRHWWVHVATLNNGMKDSETLQYGFVVVNDSVLLYIFCSTYLVINNSLHASQRAAQAGKE